MTHKLQRLNCFWLLIPALVWNVALTPHLAQAISPPDADVPRLVLTAEWVLRIAVFAWPLFLPLCWECQRGRAGLAVYGLGMLVYFASWLPLILRPEWTWSVSAVGLLAPAYTPLIWLSGIAMVGGSWSYAALSLLFVAVHVYHNILAHGLLGAAQASAGSGPVLIGLLSAEVVGELFLVFMR